MSKDITLDSPEKVHELMEFVLNHYITHHSVVQKKLEHARNATMQSIKDIEDICARFQIHEKMQEFEEIKRFDALWSDIITMFRKSGIPEDELQKIEGLLLSIPQAIKQYYDVLVQQDKALVKLIGQLDFGKYEEATSMIRKIQDMPNPMSGLTDAAEFMSAAENDDGPLRHGYIFKVPSGNKNKSRH